MLTLLFNLFTMKTLGGVKNMNPFYGLNVSGLLSRFRCVRKIAKSDY